jgi:hypothetical protein
LHLSVKSSSASTRSRNQTAARLWFPLQTLQTSHCQLFSVKLCLLQFKWTPLLLPSSLETSSCQRTVFPCGPCRLHIVNCFPPCSHLRCRTRTPPIFISSSCCPACSLSRVFTPAFSLPHSFMHSLTMIGFLSQISSLSAPGPTGPTGPLTAVTSPSGQAISPRFGWAHRTIPAVRVSPLPCFRPRIDGHRLLRSPLMSSRPRAETLLLAQLQSTISRP